MKILITGGAGFIGTHLACHLARNPEHSIVVLDNLYRGSRKGLGDIDFVCGDIRDRAVLTDLVGGVDVIFHLAAQSNVIGATQDLDYSFSTNVVGTFNVLTAAQQAGCKKVIVASSREVYGEKKCFPVRETAELEPKNAYGVSKMVGEAYCGVFRSAGLPITILRLANVYGTGDRGRVIPIFVDNALRGEPLVLYGGDQVLDFVWLDTVIEALERVLAADAIEDPVNIGSGIGIPVRELAQIVIQQTGSSSPIVEAPRRACETRGFIADIRQAIQLGLIGRPESRLQHLDYVIRDCRVRLNEAGRLRQTLDESLPVR